MEFDPYGYSMTQKIYNMVLNLYLLSDFFGIIGRLEIEIELVAVAVAAGSSHPICLGVSV